MNKPAIYARCISIILIESVLLLGACASSGPPAYPESYSGEQGSHYLIGSLQEKALPALLSGLHSDNDGGIPELADSAGLKSRSAHLRSLWQHETLLEESDLLTQLAESLATGVITGYDIRPLNVFAHGLPQHFLIYSHSSAQHLAELIAVLGEHGLQGQVYLAPKVSGFVFRVGWGEPPSNVFTLADGTKVVNGREVAVMFEFESATDSSRFHSLVRQYAKREHADQKGLITDAWWQPFYYADSPVSDFERIDLIVLRRNGVEVTLTVPIERSHEVMDHLTGYADPVHRQRVWVNPAFFRFLHGDFR